MKITTIGKGNVGGGLADRWEKAGHTVTRLGSEGGDASDADVVLLAVPGGSIADALAVPKTEQALRASDLLQKSIHASFTADGHYSDWLAGRKRCGPPGKSPELTAAHAADAQATRTKRMFVDAFNPLAGRFHRRTWAADEF